MRHPEHRYRISTGIATSIADKLGMRQNMMRAAFRDGLYNRHSYRERPALVNLTSVMATIAGAVPGAAEFVTKNHISESNVVIAGLVGVFALQVAGITQIAVQSLKLDAERIDKFFKKPHAAIHTALFNHEIHDETDAHILGRGIKWLSVYMGQNIGSLQFERDEMNAIEKQLLPQDTPQQQNYEKLRQEGEVVGEAQLKVELIRALKIMRRCKNLAFREGLMRSGGPTGTYFHDKIWGPLKKGMDDLGLLEYAQSRPEPHRAEPTTSAHP